jgi:hypothetical protein
MVVITRGSAARRFLPESTEPAPSVPVDRGSLLGSRRPDKPKEISRNRRIAGGLPDWIPEPPGELRVTRGGTGR